MSTAQQLFLDHIETPIGTFAIIANERDELCMTGFTTSHPRVEKHFRRHATDPGVEITPATDPGGLSTRIAAYFAGDLAIIDELPVASVGTPFQQLVWRALRTIPCGETCSYAQLATQIGKPTAMRAVGLANGKNPIGVIVPCHRVIGADGSLTGYGGGLERKRWLLNHEHSLADGAQIGLFDQVQA